MWGSQQFVRKCAHSPRNDRGCCHFVSAVVPLFSVCKAASRFISTWHHYSLSLVKLRMRLAYSHKLHLSCTILQKHLKVKTLTCVLRHQKADYEPGGFSLCIYHEITFIPKKWYTTFSCNWTIYEHGDNWSETMFIILEKCKIRLFLSRVSCWVSISKTIYIYLYIYLKLQAFKNIRV